MNGPDRYLEYAFLEDGQCINKRHLELHYEHRTLWPHALRCSALLLHLQAIARDRSYKPTNSSSQYRVFLPIVVRNYPIQIARRMRPQIRNIQIHKITIHPVVRRIHHVDSLH